MIFSPNTRWNGPDDKAGKAGKRRNRRVLRRGAPLSIAALLVASLAGVSPGLAGTARGLMKLSGDYALERDSVKNDPELTGRLILDGQAIDWSFHSWIEGNWQADEGEQQPLAFKRHDKVWGNESRPLDVKELFTGQRVRGIDWRVGVQRFSWGRLDEFPINDLFNPWDYDQFIVRPMEERKIGVPAVSAGFGRTDWSAQLVWVPWHIPYRLPDPTSRWSVTGAESAATLPREPDLPARTPGNGAYGIRVQRFGDFDSALNLFHGFDPRPVFTTSAKSGGEAASGPDALAITPAFHRITSVGLDTATTLGPIGLRGEAAWTWNRAVNVKPDNREGIASSQIERTNAMDYGIALDYRPFEDGLLTLQAQQTALISSPEALSNQDFETLIWADLKIFWWNQKVETGCNGAYNPEHAASMIRAMVTYVFSDSWKTILTLYVLDGPPQSIFGRYAMNDQLRLELVYQW